MNEQAYINEQKRTDFSLTISLPKTPKRIFHVLLEAKNNDKIGLTRNMLTEILGLARTTIYDNLIKLQKLKITEKFIKNSGKRGRPLVFWRLKNKQS